MIEAVAVIVPAKDEEQLIGPCIASIERARAHLSEQRAPARLAQHIETYVVLVLDACLDSTRSVAESWLQRPHRIVEVGYGNVGQARAHGARCALRHFAGRDPSRIWLATTDADSRVSKRWLVEHVAAANSGADALAGTIEIDDWVGHSRAQAQAFERFYAADAISGTHPHVHGANLGVRADAYLDAGGFAGLATGEDHALWNALRQRGRRMVSKRAVKVTTSSRLRARAPHGFAGFLAEHGRRLT